LAGQDGGDFGSLAMQAEAVAGGDEDVTIVEGKLRSGRPS
jgi:hypothetical protein